MAGFERAADALARSLSATSPLIGELVDHCGCGEGFLGYRLPAPGTQHRAPAPTPAEGPAGSYAGPANAFAG
jgi:hypothetical protein